MIGRFFGAVSALFAGLLLIGAVVLPVYMFGAGLLDWLCSLVHP